MPRRLLDAFQQVQHPFLPRVENIVTRHDELFKDDVLPDAFANPAAKDVLRYRGAMTRETALFP